MRHARVAGALVVAAGMLGNADARAGEERPDVCTRDRGGGAAPVRVPTSAADFGALPEACAATSVALEGRGAALIATRDFYGTLVAGASLRARLALPGGSWLSLWAPGLEYRYVANATVDASRSSLGAGALGWHVPLAHTGNVSVAPFARVLLPTETIFHRARRYGFEHGVSVLAPIAPRWDFAAGFAFAFYDTVNGTRSLLANEMGASGDVVWRPWPALAFAAGGGLRPLEAFDARVGVRLFPGRGAFAALGALAPLVGRDRTNGALSLSFGWTAQ